MKKRFPDWNITSDDIAKQVRTLFSKPLPFLSLCLIIPVATRSRVAIPLLRDAALIIPTIRKRHLHYTSEEPESRLANWHPSSGAPQNYLPSNDLRCNWLFMLAAWVIVQTSAVSLTGVKIENEVKRYVGNDRIGSFTV